MRPSTGQRNVITRVAAIITQRSHERVRPRNWTGSCGGTVSFWSLVANDNTFVPKLMSALITIDALVAYVPPMPSNLPSGCDSTCPHDARDQSAPRSLHVCFAALFVHGKQRVVMRKSRGSYVKTIHGLCLHRACRRLGWLPIQHCT